MPIPITHLEERLSLVYVNAVVAKAGAQLLEPKGHEYGIDGHVQGIRKLPNGSYHPVGYMFMAQIKATINSIMRDDCIVYDMDVEAYNKLCDWEGSSECILVVCCLPKDETDWLSVDENQLVLKRCCYWSYRPTKETSNTSKKRITIPRSQVFDVAAVQKLLSEAGMKFP